MLSELSFTGCQLICEGIVTADITLSCDFFFFITGTVYSPSGEPLPYAAIEVRLLDISDPNQYIRVGTTFSLTDGTFGVSLPQIHGKQYQLLAYSAL